MFFPDKAKAFAETRRVLAPGGVFLFNAWDRIEDNEIADTVTAALATLYPADPPRFMARVPHGYHDLAAIVARREAGRLRRVGANLDGRGAQHRAIGAHRGRRRIAWGRRCATRSKRATPAGSTAPAG